MRARAVGLGIRCLLNEMPGLPGRVYGTAARLPIGGGSLLTNLLPDDLPLNPSDHENTPAITQEKPQFPANSSPKTTATNRVTAAELFVAKKTFADFFDELGGILGAIGGNKGRSQGWLLGVRLVVGNVEMNDGPLGDAGSFTMEARPGRVSEDGGMEGWSVGV